MNHDNIIKLNIPNVITIGLIALIFFAVLGGIGGIARSAMSNAQ